MTAMLSARTNATNETRKVEDSQGRQRVLSRAAISAEVRVHLYERSFPEEPDRHAGAVA
jgi:hypothetical protein